MAEKPEARLRVFFALWPPAAVAVALHRIASTVAREAGGRPMARDTLHQTLAFIGEVPESQVAELQKLAAGLADCAAGTLNLDQLGYWRHNHIVWAAPSMPTPSLSMLAERLGLVLERGGFRVEKRPFHPHITLLRNVRRVPDLPVLPSQQWPVDDFVLVASQLTPGGSRYRIIGRWPLAAG